MASTAPILLDPTTRDDLKALCDEEGRTYDGMLRALLKTYRTAQKGVA